MNFFDSLDKVREKDKDFLADSNEVVEEVKEDIPSTIAEVRESKNDDLTAELEQAKNEILNLKNELEKMKGGNLENDN